MYTSNSDNDSPLTRTQRLRRRGRSTRAPSLGARLPSCQVTHLYLILVKSAHTRHATLSVLSRYTRPSKATALTLASNQSSPFVVYRRSRPTAVSSRMGILSFTKRSP